MMHLNLYYLKNKNFWCLLTLLYFNLVLGQDLSQYIQEAMENNPQIQAFELQYKISEAKIEEVQTLPNTQFGIGYFVSETETRVGAQRLKVFAKQQLPWFGTITSRKNYKKVLSETKYEEIVLAKRKLIAAISQSYHTLYALKEKGRILEENKTLLGTYKTLLLNAVTVGKASAVAVLKLQLRQDEIQEIQYKIEREQRTEETHFNALLNRSTNQKISIPEEITPPEKEGFDTAEKLSLHPELLIYDKLYESVIQSEWVNQKESRPQVGLGLDYIAVDERLGLTIDDNGKDMIMPSISISIPIFNNKYKSKSLQNELKQKEITLQKQERFNRLKVTLEKAINERMSAQVSYKTQLTNSQQADELSTLLLKNYETASIDFNELLELQELQLKFKIKQIEAIHSYYKQTIIINYLIN